MKVKHPFRRIKQSFLDLQIRKKLLISFAALIVLPVTLMAVFYLTNSKIILEQKSSVYTSNVLSELKTNLENTVSELDGVFMQLANDPNIQQSIAFLRSDNSTPEERQQGVELANDALRDQLYSHSGLISSLSLVLCNNPSVSISNPSTEPLIPDEDALKQVIDHSSKGIWLREKSDTITYVRLIISSTDLSPAFYLVINMPEEALFDIYSSISLYNEDEIFITDKDGYIISHSGKTLLGNRVGQDYLNLVSKSDGTPFSLQTINGQHVYIACKHINGGQWRLFYEVSATSFEQDFISLTQTFFIITIFILLLSLSVSVFLAKSISNPISRLSKTMQQVQNGNFNIRSDYHSQDEVGILSDNFNTMIENTNELIQTIYQKELLKQQAELKFLQFQINPHFLYNTLETINWISRIHGVPEAGEIAKALGDLMREGLREADFVPLENEIRNVKNYLLIQQYRYGDKIKVSINIDPSLLQVKTPKFILQPIIENAITHGVDPKIEGGTISVFGVTDGTDTILTVEDDGVGIPADKLRNLLNENIRKADQGKHTHIGLLNVHKRLQLYFGSSYGLTINSEEGAGTVVIIRLPNHPDDPPKNKEGRLS